MHQYIYIYENFAFKIILRKKVWIQVSKRPKGLRRAKYERKHMADLDTEAVSRSLVNRRKVLYPPISFALATRGNRMSFCRKRGGETRNDAAPDSQFHMGRKWKWRRKRLVFFLLYGRSSRTGKECARFFDESCDRWGEVLIEFC